MNLDRIGTALLVIAAAWYGWLLFDLPSLDVEVPWRNELQVALVATLVLAIFPKHIQLTGTVLAFAVLGICVNLAMFNYDALGWKGVLPVAIVAVAIWCRSNRMDMSDVIGVSAVVAFGIAIVQPGIVAFAFLFILVVNVIIWIVNRFGKSRTA